MTPSSAFSHATQASHSLLSNLSMYDCALTCARRARAAHAERQDTQSASQKVTTSVASPMFTERAIAARRRRERGTGDETTPLKSDDAIKTADIIM